MIPLKIEIFGNNMKPAGGGSVHLVTARGESKGSIILWFRIGSSPNKISFRGVASGDGLEDCTGYGRNKYH